MGLFFILLFFNCNNKKKEQSIKLDQVISIQEGEPDEPTKEMIKKVEEAVAKIDVQNVPYILNSKKVNILAAKLQNLNGLDRVNILFTYGMELLNAGKTEESIATLNEVLSTIEQSNIKNKSQILFVIKKQLAIAYIRKAELDNCLNNHNNESCIIPISPKAQHKLKEGAEKAINILNELLKNNPNDLECQYLLNIANMTLGTYPKNVPSEYRIPESYFSSATNFPKFSDIAMDLGVAENKNAGGTCVDDFNGDGYLDIIASSWGFQDQIKYFENDQNGSFIDKTIDAGLKGVTGGLNLRHADYNNDGYLDFIILRGAWLSNNGGIPNSLMKNNGDGTFTDVTIASGIYSLNPTQTAVWSDFNLDGWVDLFIANEWSENKKSECELFLNQSNGTFKNITKEAGISAIGFFKGVASGDLNNDLYPDLYLSNYSGENTLYINTTKENESPSFKIKTEQANVGMPIYSFPTWVFDYNNDGFEDIFVSGYSTVENLPAQMMMQNIKTNKPINHPLLYKNNGDGTFEEVSLSSNLNEPIATMGCNFGDLDNDGFLDFYLATGDPDYFSIVPNRMYHNISGSKFEDITYSAGFGHIQKGHAIGFGDLDLDGDQDIYAVMGGAFEGDTFQNLLFENPLGNKNNWINIVLQGKESNRCAIGAKLILTIEEHGKMRSIYYSVGTDASFGGNSMMAEIGLGKATLIKKLIVKWPHHTKNVSEFTDIEVNKTIKIVEGNAIDVLNLKTLVFKTKSNNEMQHHNHH
ncbi:CRTAC1 family protein [Flaviramulus sp. BrNp1-15]|uniref:CRTAC1 family protein n=1 Tax=Flaviramulus sp. BrNp1-15 TaxID=2916754 RepID=UPI001EE93B29|nr:CRTAC1 family protein [Flaviramulus sp. BrNp1-15]ULC60755.1 CRTAC1 family protein [Flaviramulus sp. BrNp1-15]